MVYKKDNIIDNICKIYEELYKLHDEGKLFPNISNLMVYSPEEVEKAIRPVEKETEKKRKAKIDDNHKKPYENRFQVYTQDEVRYFLKTEKDNNKITANDLRYMYKVVFGMECHKSLTKRDIINKLQDYFRGLDRTADLKRNIR